MDIERVFTTYANDIFSSSGKEYVEIICEVVRNRLYEENFWWCNN